MTRSSAVAIAFLACMMAAPACAQSGQEPSFPAGPDIILPNGPLQWSEVAIVRSQAVTSITMNGVPLDLGASLNRTIRIQMGRGRSVTFVAYRDGVECARVVARDAESNRLAVNLTCAN